MEENKFVKLDDVIKIIDDERAYLTTKSDHYRSYDDKSYHYDFARRSILLREIKDKIIDSCKE